jgi:hypothetical protein
MVKEIWKKVNLKPYGEVYAVSNLGRVRSLDRWVKYNKSSDKETLVVGRVLKPVNTTHGYDEVVLCYKGKTKRITVHRLVALTFIPNPHNYYAINHKDENKKNNRVDNLEWCTIEYNNRYGTMPKRISEKLMQNNPKAMAVNVYDSKNVKRCNSLRQAVEYSGISRNAITNHIEHRTPIKGFAFEYVQSPWFSRGRKKAGLKKIQ